MKIQFKQQGGAMPPYVSYTPFVPASQPNIPVQQQQQQQSTTTKDSTKQDMSDKDLLNMIEKIDGLPNDMENIILELKQMYTIQSILPSTSSSKKLVDLYLNSLYKAKVANFNKKEFDDTYNLVKSNKGLSEVAITTDGNLVAQNLNTGEIKQLTVNDYLSNKQKYEEQGIKLLTNSNLLYIRAHYPQFTFKNEIFQIVENGIGLEKVQNLLRDNVSTLGKTENTIITDVYKQNGKVVAGMEILQNLKGTNTSIDGLYEAKKITPEQRQQAKAAVEYLYATLPENAKTLLDLKSGKGKGGSLKLIEYLILSKSDIKQSNERAYKGDYNLNGTKRSSGSKNGDSDNLKYNTAAQLLLGVGYKSNFVIQDGTSDGIVVRSNEFPATNGQQTLGKSSLLDLTKSDYGGILQFKDATMGGIPISQNALNKVITDGIVHSLDMIIDQDAAQKGIIKPDLKALKRKQQADDYIKQNNIDEKDINKVNEVYKKFNLPMLYDQNGRLNAVSYARFAVFDGTAISSAFENSSDSDITFNDYLKELEGQDEQNALEEFKQSDPKMHYDSKSWWDSISPVFNGHDSIYKGTIFIPIKPHVLNAMAGTNLTGEQIMQIEDAETAKIAQQRKLQGWNNGNNLKE